MMEKFDTVEAYLSELDDHPRALITAIHEKIRTSVPEAQSCIAYNMPAFKYKGKPLVYFAAFKQHIGLYALPQSNTEFSESLKVYKTGKGSIQFPINAPLPYDLIEMIVRFRKEEIDAKIKK
ncbi:MAG: DUF1801 domain-containing protein [Saprospiraceae bacterium]